MALLKAAEILAHPAFQHMDWDLPPTTSGKALVAKGRSGGPFNLYYEIHGTGSRRIVWIMGLGAYYTAWKRQTRHFGHQKGDQYSALVFDNRGMGRSDKPFCRYSTSEMAKDLIDLLVHVGWLDGEDAKGQGTQRKVHVVGVSMGGMIAQEMALLIPKSIASLCFVSTAPRIVRTVPFLENLKARALMFIPRDVDDELNGVAHRLFADEFLALPDTEARELGFEEEGRTFPCNQDRVGAGELHKRQDKVGFTKKGFIYQAIAAGWHSKSKKDLKRLAEEVGRRRIEVFHGTADGMLVFQHGELLVKELNDGVEQGEDKVEFRVWKGDGHVLPWEKRDEFNAAVEAVIGKGESLR
jgi:pimeloyl-ACP methyl ester carboxylesterase